MKALVFLFFIGQCFAESYYGYDQRLRSYAARNWGLPGAERRLDRRVDRRRTATRNAAAIAARPVRATANGVRAVGRATANGVRAVGRVTVDNIRNERRAPIRRTLIALSSTSRGEFNQRSGSLDERIRSRRGLDGGNVAAVNCAGSGPSIQCQGRRYHQVNVSYNDQMGVQTRGQGRPVSNGNAVAPAVSWSWGRGLHINGADGTQVHVGGGQGVHVSGANGTTRVGGGNGIQVSGPNGNTRIGGGNGIQVSGPNGNTRIGGGNGVQYQGANTNVRVGAGRGVTIQNQDGSFARYDNDRGFISREQDGTYTSVGGGNGFSRRSPADGSSTSFRPGRGFYHRGSDGTQVQVGGGNGVSVRTAGGQECEAAGDFIACGNNFYAAQTASYVGEQPDSGHHINHSSRNSEFNDPLRGRNFDLQPTRRPATTTGSGSVGF